MKQIVLLNSLETLNYSSFTNPNTVIVLASLCDYLNKKNLLAERLTKSFSEDLNYCISHYSEFKVLNGSIKEFDIYSSNDNDKLYREFKHQTYIQSETNEEEMTILELLDNSIFERRIYEQNAEKVLSTSIAKWLVNDSSNNKIYCPFNNLIYVELALTNDNELISTNISTEHINARTMYYICNGLKVPKHPIISFEQFGSLQEPFDLGFSFPPLAIRVKSENFGEYRIIKDMLNNVKGRFCIILALGFTFQSGPTEKLRKQILNEKRLKAVVELPSGLFASTSISTVALFFDKADENQDSINLISLTDDKCKNKATNGRNRIVLNDFAMDILNKGLNGEDTIFSKKVSLEEIANLKFILSPDRYILSPEEIVAQEQILKGDTKLSEIAEFLRVQAIKPDSSGETFYEVNAASINCMGFIDTIEKQFLLSKDNPATKNPLQKNDIIFAIKGSVGKVGFVATNPQNCLINQSFVIIRITDPKWPAEFVFRQLKSSTMKLFIQSKTIGAVIPTLNMSELKDIPLISPTEELVNAQKEKHERQIELTKKIAMLQEELLELNNF
jgi:hypothetical protein